jgi:hypothetical protein
MKAHDGRTYVVSEPDNDRFPHSPWAEEDIDEMGLWVVEYGIPPLPDRLDLGMIVPIASWVDDELAAVMSLSWGEGISDDETTIPAAEFNLQSFTRREASWEPECGSGGGGWWDPALDRPPLNGTQHALGHEHCTWSDWSACVTGGAVGPGITHIELERQGQTLRRSVDSPLGAVVAVTPADVASVLRAFTADGDLITSVAFGGHHRP